MSRKAIRFTASSVECSEAIDWEIVQVTFDTMVETFDEVDRTSPYVMLSANFELNDRIGVEYHDGEGYAGDGLVRIDLWRNRALVLTVRGYEFDVSFDLSEDAFAELREYLHVLLRSDCFRL